MSVNTSNFGGRHGGTFLSNEFLHFLSGIREVNCLEGSKRKRSVKFEKHEEDLKWVLERIGETTGQPS